MSKKEMKKSKKILENFIKRDDNLMQFEEMQAMAKILLCIYEKINELTN